MAERQLPEELGLLPKVADPVLRRARFMALLSREIERRGGKAPVLVGGEAMEIYTQGGYTTGDIDIKGPRELILVVLSDWGFLRKGRNLFHPGLDIWVDWLGESLDEGPGAEARINELTVAEEGSVRLVSVEDLLVDRLNAAKWWQDSDSAMWAEMLLRSARRAGLPVDLDYLRQRAREEDVEDVLDRLLAAASENRP